MLALLLKNPVPVIVNIEKKFGGYPVQILIQVWKKPLVSCHWIFMTNGMCAEITYSTSLPGFIKSIPQCLSFSLPR